MTLQVWLKHERAPTSISEIPRKSSPQFLSIHEDHIPRLRVPTGSCTSTTVPLGGYTGIMEKKMETTIVYWGYIGIMEEKMETTICTSTLRMISSNLANPATGVGTQALRVQIREHSRRYSRAGIQGILTFRIQPLGSGKSDPVSADGKKALL